MDIFSKTVIQKHGRTYKKDELIFSEGEPCDKMFIIKEGDVRILKREQGEDIYLSTLGPGEFIGELGDGTQPRNVSAVAETPCALVAIDAETFSQLIDDNPLLAWKVIKKLNHRLRIMNERLLKATVRDDPGRLAVALMNWYDDPRRQEKIDETALATAAGVLPSVARALLSHLAYCEVLQEDGPGKWALKDLGGLREFNEYCIRKKQLDPLGIKELARLAGILDDEARILAIRAIEKRIGTESSSFGSIELMTPLQRYLKLKLRFELNHADGIEKENLPQEMPT